MIGSLPTRLALLLPTVFLAAGCALHAQPPAVPVVARAATDTRRPSVVIQSPVAGDTLQGVTIVRFRVENAIMTSPFRAAAPDAGAEVPAHLHVTVDGTTWHWVHATADPVVITPLAPGDHTVTLELAGADHRPLDSKTVRFTVVARAAVAAAHAAHR
jgi:hypothetical protein